jgi:hypothetical protein
LPVVGQIRATTAYPQWAFVRIKQSVEEKGVCALVMPVFSGRCVEFRQRAAGRRGRLCRAVKHLSVCSSRLWLIGRKARPILASEKQNFIFRLIGQHAEISVSVCLAPPLVAIATARAH